MTQLIPKFPDHHLVDGCWNEGVKDGDAIVLSVGNAYARDRLADRVTSTASNVLTGVVGRLLLGGSRCCRQMRSPKKLDQGVCND